MGFEIYINHTLLKMYVEPLNILTSNVLCDHNMVVNNLL